MNKELQVQAQRDVIGDMVTIDKLGRAHRQDGKFMSNQNLALIEEHQGLIREQADAYQMVKQTEIELAPAVAQVPAEAKYDLKETFQPAVEAPRRSTTAAAVGAAAVERKGWLTRANEAIKNSSTTRKIALSVAAAATLIASFGALSNNNESDTPREPRTEVAGPNTESIQLASSSSAVDSEASAQRAYEQRQQVRDQQEMAKIDETVLNKLAEMGVGMEQVERFADFDAVITSPIEANFSSMNMGLTHDLDTLTVHKSLQKSVEILNGTHGPERAALARQAMINEGYSEAIIDEVTKGDFSNITFYAYRLKSDSATIKNTAYRKADGTLGYADIRKVGGQDTIVLAVEKADAENAHASRVDCGVMIQPFEDIDLPEAPAPVPTPPVEETPPVETPPEEEVPPTTTTVPPTTTTTVPPTTTTTVPSTTTTTAPTTTTTQPPTTTTTRPNKVPTPLPTTPEYPDQEPGDPGVNPNIPDTGNTGQDEDGYLPGQNPNPTTTTTPEQVPDEPINDEDNPSDGTVPLEAFVGLPLMGLVSEGARRRMRLVSAPKGMDPIELVIDEEGEL